MEVGMYYGHGLYNSVKSSNINIVEIEFVFSNYYGDLAADF